MSFDHLQSIFRSYDIRGLYPDEFNPDIALKIAHALAYKYKPKKVAIGRDNRSSGVSIAAALSKGFLKSGIDVVDLGLTTTPMTYFYSAHTDVDMTISVTASHLPSQFNGMKICVEDARPLNSEEIKHLEVLVTEQTSAKNDAQGTLQEYDLRADWQAFFDKKFDFSGTKLKLVVDPANMIGVIDIDTFKNHAPHITTISICDELNEQCPHHEADPIKLDTLAMLGEKVCETGAHLGIAFDGDADRLGFVDENGTPVPADLIGALLVRYILAEHPGASVVRDLRSSKSIDDLIEQCGGTSVSSRVGHSHVRSKMREVDAVLGIELSGHFFFKETGFSEGGPLPAFILMQLMTEQNLPLSKLVDEVRTYCHSSEINSVISRPADEIYNELKHRFAEAEFIELDGLSILMPDWWCNVRPSSNEPVMRLNLEAINESVMAQKRDEVLEIIRK